MILKMQLRCREFSLQEGFRLASVAGGVSGGLQTRRRAGGGLRRAGGERKREAEKCKAMKTTPEC